MAAQNTARNDMMSLHNQPGAWVRRSFMLPRNTVDAALSKKKAFNGVRIKYTDTTLGGNFAINPPPQFTRFADIKIGNRYAGGKGMGRYYSEAIDDNSININMRFGVAKYNGILAYILGWYSPNAGRMARTGQSAPTLVAGLIGGVISAIGFVLTAPIGMAIAAHKIYRFLAARPMTKYYYLDPTPPLYWSAVNLIVNQFAQNRGIIPRIGDYAEYESMETNETKAETKAMFDQLRDLMPGDILRENGGIDAYALISKTQRRADKWYKELQKAIEDGDDRLAVVGQMGSMLDSYIGENTEGINFDNRNTFPEFDAEIGTDPDGRRRSDWFFRGSIEQYLSAFLTIPQRLLKEGEEMSPLDEEDQVNGKAQKPAAYSMQTEGKEEEIATQKGWWENATSYFVAEARDATQFMTLKVNNPGTVSESWSNSTTQSEFQGMLHGMSSSARSTRRMIGQGQTGIDMIDDVVASVGYVASKTAEAFKLGGLLGLAGNAFPDVPEMWDDSSVSLPTASYTIQLRSPYGNTFSQFFNIDVPLAMLLAGALPLSAGRRAYCSPFLCELFSKGKQIIRLGIISDLSITRGQGNLGWSQDERAYGIDVTFTVKDLSSVMHMPIMGTGNIFDLTSAFEEDSAFYDYLATVSSMSMADQLYVLRKARINFTRKFDRFKQWFSMGRVASEFGTSMPGRIVSGLAVDSDRYNDYDVAGSNRMSIVDNLVQSHPLYKAGVALKNFVN